MKKNNDFFKISTQKLGFMHIFMKFWKHSLFVYIFISFEFSLDNVLGSLITNESENHFSTINIILFHVESFFCQILRFWFWLFFIALTSEDACLEKVIIPSKNIIYCIIKFFFIVFFFFFFYCYTKSWTSQILVRVLVKSNFFDFIILWSVLLVLRKTFHWY